MKRILPILSIILLTAFSSPANTFPLSETADPIIRTFPNPATTIVNFEFQKGYEKGYTIQIYSFLGKKVFETPVTTQRTTINLNDFNRGVYIYYLLDNTGRKVESGKFQVSK